ncbi:helicase-related protein [Chloroflexus sp.]|uniref:helicase-related protein n=1 Tax=Chloroflexus sp. TaxID=1904827 RepID=UPI004048FDD7
MHPGTIVQVRNRYWVLLPHEDPDCYLLRPLTGATDETVAIHKGLADRLAYTLPTERLQPATFPLPTVADLADAAGAHLLWQAARLTLREGATPLRSLGRISIRPRPYQFVPLLMALRLDPLRLLIADDVGVGKTIEALLIARELWDRGEIKRLAVLCPPYLCDQWQRELDEKFNLEAVVVRSGTVGRLERGKPPTRTLYEHYPIQVISIDFVKSERNRHQFLLHAPDLVIVDEAHGATLTYTQSQQQRHDLVRAIAQDERRHLILLTATPHSGIETAFRSLLSLLKPTFGAWDLNNLDETQRAELARHFVQRTRKDIEQDWEHERCFPRRLTADETYRLSPAYRTLFEKTYDFCAEIVRTGAQLEERKRRVRYWGALALLRCVMSSPAAAQAALETRYARQGEGDDEVDFRGFVFEAGEERTDDEQPTAPLEATAATLPEGDRRRLRELGRLAARIIEARQDTKLDGLIRMVEGLLGDGFHPIVWCRYVATADYVAAGLQRHLPADVRVVCITGRQGDAERRARIDEIETDRPRVLVATDCLSEGINLQQKFTAAIHYDLPWNPNRLEQREGRVDRYGQTAPEVKTIRYFSPDNPVDGVVIEVLLDKARQIHRTLGTHVPVPAESESVTEAVLNALFLRGGRATAARQLAFDFAQHDVQALHRRWEQDAERERLNRTRFAQRALKPQEVQRELEATDAVLGDPDAVRAFVLAAAQRLGLHIARDSNRPGVYRIPLEAANLAPLPEPVRFALPAPAPSAARRAPPPWSISFDSPTPEGAAYLGRNHPFVVALARFLLEEALTRPGQAHAARCGVLCTRAVSQTTTLLLVRVRYLIEQPERTPLFAEEVRTLGYTQGADGAPHWLDESATLRLLEAQPDANLVMAEKRRRIEAALAQWGAIVEYLQPQIEARARDLEAAHKRIRQAVHLRTRALTVRPQWPVDLLGILVLEPDGSL